MINIYEVDVRLWVSVKAGICIRRDQRPGCLMNGILYLHVMLVETNDGHSMTGRDHNLTSPTTTS